MGFFLALIGIALLIFGLTQKLKGNRILAAPFHKTGHIAQNPSVADAKGMVSTEGAVSSPKPLLSPISKTPCLYFEVKVDRNWEKDEQTQNGVETKKGSTTAHEIKDGALFQLDDGSGPINVSLKEGADVETKKTFDDKVKIGAVIPGELVFGELRMQMPKFPRGERTVAFTAVEKVVPADGQLFALGKLENGTLVKPKWRSMMLSTKGRDGLIASTAKKSKIGFIAGGALAVLSIPVFIFAPKPEPKVAVDCHALITDGQTRCDDQVSSSFGKDYTWTVTRAGEYTLVVEPPKVKFPIDPAVTVKDTDGKQVAYITGSNADGKTVLTQQFAPGTYTVNVKDELGRSMKGGFSFGFEVNAPKVAEADPSDKPAADEVKPAAENPAPAPARAPSAKPAKKGSKAKHAGRAGAH